MSERETQPTRERISRRYGREGRYGLTQDQYGVLLEHIRRGDALAALAEDATLAGPSVPAVGRYLDTAVQEAVKEGDTIEGFLVRLPQPLLVTLVRRIGHPRSPMDWEDLLQESRLHVIVALRHLAAAEPRPDGNVAGYLYQSVVNGLRDVHRRAGRHERRETPVSAAVKEHDEEGGQEIAHDEWLDWALHSTDHGRARAAREDPSVICERRGFWEEVQERVGGEATALLLREHVAQTSQADIANQLGVTTRTVRNRLGRARRRLRYDAAFGQEYAPTDV